MRGALFTKVTLSRFRIRVAATALAIGLLCGNATPALSDDEHHPTPDPSSSAHAAYEYPHDDHDGDSASRERELEARYGHDRDIATPPLIVKQSFSSGKFVTKAIHVRHSLADAASDRAPQPTVSGKTISVATGKSVIQRLKPSDFESPAVQFMQFAYIVMGFLMLVLAGLAIGVTSRKDRLNR